MSLHFQFRFCGSMLELELERNLEITGYSSHCTDEEIVAQEIKVTCPQSKQLF